MPTNRAYTPAGSPATRSTAAWNRRTARALGFDYALAVKADHTATTSAGRFTATRLAARVPAKSWMRMSTGHGLKGDRHYDWAP
ncbi:hypothetical protein ACFU9X_31620 [Streptomyces atratus]|uniref:hypothetical protein n=1 Tax=Streptomyces atratus TaxID=1893 RepID=UPI0036D054C9